MTPQGASPRRTLPGETPDGAHVSDAFLALIHTAELNGVDAFDYLVALQRHHERPA